MANWQVVNHADLLNESGSLRTEFPRDTSEWVPHGNYRAIGADGKVVLEITYCHGLAHGKYVDYWSNGNVSLEGEHIDGQQHGLWHFYNKDGTLREVIKFSMGKELLP